MSPRRGPGEGSVSRRKDGRWQVRVELGRDGLGRRQRRYEYASTQAEAIRLLRRAQRAKELGQLVAPQPGTPRTVAEWLDVWLEGVRVGREPRTYMRYESIVRIHLLPALGSIRLAKLTPERIERFLVAKRKAYEPTTVKGMQAVLSAALGKAVRMGLLGRNVAAAEHFDLTWPEARIENVLNLAQARAFLAAVKGDRLYALYVLALVLGQRQSELLGLRWDDVDLEAGRLRLYYKLARVDGGWQLRGSSQTKRTRKVLPLLEPAAAALRDHQVRQQREREFAGSRWQTMEHAGREVELVFTGRLGSPLHGSSVTQAFQLRLRRAGLPVMRFHDLRHSAASIMLALGVPLKTISEVLGQSSIRVTADIYGHLADDVLRHQMERVADAWVSTPEVAPGVEEAT